MSEIRITPGMQLFGLLAIAGVIAVAVMGQLPEIRRYLKIEAM